MPERRAFLVAPPGPLAHIGRMSDLDRIIADFALLDDWDDRYRYLIELGRELEPLPDAARSDANKVRGCASQVWLETIVSQTPAGAPALTLRVDSDAHIVRGLARVVVALYSGRLAAEILDTDIMDVFRQLGLDAHLTPQRSNGVRAMVERVKSDARDALHVA